MTTPWLRRLTPTSFRGRIVFSTVGLIAATMLISGVAVQLILAHTATRDIQNRLDDRSTAVIALINQASRRHVKVSAQALPLGVRVYDESGQSVAGEMEQEVHSAADRLAAPGSTLTDLEEHGIRLRSAPFNTPSGDSGTVVVSQEIAPYERAEHYALIVTVVLGLCLVASAAVVARRVTDQALQPVVRMAESASEWSEHDLAQRFDLPPADDELTGLADTLDRLLDRVAAAIRAEQHLTAELAHELRTPLTAIQGSADLALLRGVDDAATRRDVEQISASARDMAEVITTLLDVAHQSGAASSATSTAAMLVEPVRNLVPGHLSFVDDTGDSHARLAAPTRLMLRALSPVVANAVRHARSTVTLTAVDVSDAVLISVIDDGPGGALPDNVFDPGVSTSGGTGLGLGIARRVARSWGGEISIGSHRAGTSFTLRVPRA